MRDDPQGDDPGHHRTIDRMTQILEEIAYRPGIGFAELARALGAPKSSVHGFVRGLQAKGWLHEVDRRFYLGPAVHGITLASGRFRAGQVSQADLDALHAETGMAVFLGVEAGDRPVYIGWSGTSAHAAARSDIRRTLVNTAAGKALLAAKAHDQRDAYLRREQVHDSDAVSGFIAEFAEIRRTGVARNLRHHGAQLAFGSVVHDHAGEAVAVAVLIGRTADVEPREQEIRAVLLKRVASWTGRKRLVGS